MERAKEACETCRFWDRELVDNCENAIGDKWCIAFCRRWPPVWLGGEDTDSVSSFSYPKNQHDGWCGEWRARTPDEVDNSTQQAQPATNTQQA